MSPRHIIQQLHATDAALDALRSTASVLEFGERRRFARFSTRCQGRLTPADAGAARLEYEHVQIRDISRGGAGLLVMRHLLMNQHWRLDIVRHDVVLASVPVFVRHCRRAFEDVNLAGVAFGMDDAILMASGVDRATLRHADHPDEESWRSGCFAPAPPEPDDY